MKRPKLLNSNVKTTLASNQPRFPRHRLEELSAERLHVLNAKSAEISRNLKNLSEEQTLDQLAAEISLMTKADIDDWYRLLVPGEDVKAQVRAATNQAAARYIAECKPIPAHVSDALEIANRVIPTDVCPQKLRHFGSSDKASFFARSTRLLQIKLRRRNIPEHLIHDIVRDTMSQISGVVKEDIIPVTKGLGAFVNSVCNQILVKYRASISATNPADAKFSTPIKGQPNGENAAVKNVRQVLGGLSPEDRDIMKEMVCNRSRADLPAQRPGDPTRRYELLRRAITQFQSLRANSARLAVAGTD